MRCEITRYEGVAVLLWVRYVQPVGAVFMDVLAGEIHLSSTVSINDYTDLLLQYLG